MGGATFSVQGTGLGGPGEWVALAQAVEAGGFHALLAADHPGVSPSPFVALAAAAAATGRIRLGTYVCNVGLRAPLDLASDTATLDALSGGRAVLGVGAGHTPAEWAAAGRPYPSPAARAERLAEVVPVLRRLLAGEVVTATGGLLQLEGAALQEPRPVQDPVPLLVGVGGGRRTLRAAAEHADVVGLTGLGRTLPDGHHHEARWAPAAIDEQVGRVHAASSAAGRPGPPALEALVQHVEVTDDRERVGAAMAARVPGLAPGDPLTAPFCIIGTEAEMAAHVAEVGRRWGITRFVVRPPAMDAVAPLLLRAEPA